MTMRLPRQTFACGAVIFLSAAMDCSALAECFDAELTLLHVVEPPTLPDWGYANLVHRDDLLKSAAHEKLASFAFARLGLSRRLMNIAVRAGEPKLQITEVARELGTELLTDGQMVTVSCAEGDTGFVYDGKLPFDVTRTSLKNLGHPRTKVMMNLGYQQPAGGCNGRSAKRGAGLEPLRWPC